MKDIDENNAIDPQSAYRVTLPRGNEHHLLQSGDILFRSRGRSNGAALVPFGIGPAVLAAPMLRIRPSNVHPGYLSWFLNTSATQTVLATRAEGTSVQMISAEALKGLRLPLPSPETQAAIAHMAALADTEHRLAVRTADLRRQRTEQLLTTRAHEATR